VHFAKDQIPPVRVFWLLTMYNHKEAFADNPLNRYALGDRDPLKFNPDGSLNFFILRESPGQDKESNWLPTPQDGRLVLQLRIYWSKTAVLDGAWVLPSVKRVE
jgi:hypothetical protein